LRRQVVEDVFQLAPRGAADAAEDRISRSRVLERARGAHLDHAVREIEDLVLELEANRQRYVIGGRSFRIQLVNAHGYFRSMARCPPLPPETQSPWQVDPARGFVGAERLRT
jgi:hypothetical protein